MSDPTRRPSAPIITRDRAELLAKHAREMADKYGTARDFKRAAREQDDADRYDSIVAWFDNQPVETEQPTLADLPAEAHAAE